MSVWLVGAAMLIGMATGWVVRSIQFGLDQDCANPDHKKE